MGALLTPAVMRDLARIIEEHHTAVAAVLYGPDAVSPEDWQLAVSLGLVDPTEPPEAVMANLHVYGALLAHLDQAQAQARYGSTVAELKSEIRRNPVPMTEQEYHAATWAARRAAQYVVGLGNKAGATIGSSLIEADKTLDKRMRDTIRDVVAARFGDEDAKARMKQRGLAAGLPPDYYDGEFRSTVKRMVSDIGHATDDWTRDIQRIAQTEATAAVHEGMAESWREQAVQQQKRTLVFKLPRPSACPHCRRLHLDGDVPRVYDLAAVEGNSNVKQRANDWQFTVGPVHPWDACALVRVPFALEPPKGWRSGEAMPSVIGPGGRLAGAA